MKKAKTITDYTWLKQRNTMTYVFYYTIHLLEIFSYSLFEI